MSIIRVRKDARYFSASNEPFNDKALSWESRGLMGYLLSKPDGWEIRFGDLLKQAPAKEFKLRRILAELMKARYVNRIRISNPDGTFDWTTEVYESPSQNPRKASSSRFSTSGLPTCGKPRDIVSTEQVSTENDDKEIKNRTKTLVTLYESNIGAITPLMADVLRNAAIEFPEPWYEPAFKVALENNVRKWKYVDAILVSWHKNGFGWKPEKPQKNASGYQKPSRPAPVDFQPEKIAPSPMPADMRHRLQKAVGK